MTALLDHLRARMADGRKLLIPYIMSGLPDRASFPEALAVVSAHGDACEVGLPYSDPLMDGPVIAGAGERVLRSGLGPLAALDLAAGDGRPVPTVVMTYYNPIHRLGEKAFCERLVAAGVTGLIVPDLPLEESAGLREALRASDLAWIPLVAPTSSVARTERIAASATGFIYAVATLGVTGARPGLSDRAAAVAQGCRDASDLPVVLGVGVSDAAQAAQAAAVADGVVVGSAVVAALLEGGAAAAGSLLAGIREALDHSSP